jgi:hypothetical protein
MMNFIVLGYVPGTHFQISFGDIILGMTVLGSFFSGLQILWFLMLRHAFQQFKKKCLANRAVRAKYSRRIAAILRANNAAAQ